MNFLGEVLNLDTYNPASIIDNYFKTDNSYYTGYAKIIMPPFTENKAFHSILAVNNSNVIIPNSNSFFIDSNFSSSNRRIGYNKIHTIFSRLEITYKYLINNPIDITINDEMYLLCNPFSATNVGHDLSILLDRIHIYRSNKLSIPVVLSEYMLTIPRSLEICQLLLPDVPIYYLPNNKIVQFTKLHIPPNIVFDILRHKYLVDEIINTAINHISIKDKIDEYKNKKILLIKTPINNNILTQATCITGNNTLNMLCSKYNYMYINPERMNMLEIIAYLYYAQKIVTSYGAISYAHTMFFNPHIKYYFLKLEDYPYFYLDKHIIINLHNTNLDTIQDQLPVLLDDI